MLSELTGGGFSLARARAAMSLLTICDGSSSSCTALPLPLPLGLGVPFFRGVAANLVLVVSDEEAVVGMGLGGGAEVVSFVGTWVLRIDLG